MRQPIRLNAAKWPGWLVRTFRGREDPRVLRRKNLGAVEFAAAVSVLKFGRTFKSTCTGRFPNTLKAVAALPFSRLPSVLDIGVSDGSTSVDIMSVLRFDRYVCADLNLSVRYAVKGRWTFFFDEAGAPLLAVSDRWVVYPDVSDAPAFVARLVARVFRAADPELVARSERIELINPALRARLSDRVMVVCHDAREAWNDSGFDLIVVANLLNRDYFDDDTIATIIRNAAAAMADEGWIVLIDNRETERSSILHVRPSGVAVVTQIGGGAESETVALRTLSP